MFGLFGIKQILLPQDINEITMIDISIYFIYVLLIFSVPLAILKIYLNQNTKFQKEISDNWQSLSHRESISEFLRDLINTKQKDKANEKTNQELLQDLILKD
jgi:hypothetical protein